MKVLLFGLAWFSILSAQHAPVLVLRNATVIDGVSSEPQHGLTIVVENGRIKSAGKNVIVVPSGAIQMDLRGLTLLPGLIDSHVHIDTLAGARAAAAAGITTVRTMQVSHYVDVGMREMHRNGHSDLPDVVSGGYQLRPDMFESFFLDHPKLADMMPKVTGADGARRLVRANIARGVDHIKILATERGGTPNTDPRRRTWSDEELVAIVDEAKKGGLAVTAHAHADGGAVAAIRAGVREINHGSFLNDETLALMKASGTYFLTTLAVGDTIPATMAQQDPKFWERVLEFKRESASAAARAWKMGLLLVAGTDGDYKSVAGFTIVNELSALVKVGVPAMEAIKAATYRAAESLEISQRTGAIKPGLEADLIAVGDDPITNVEVLRNPVLIVNDGHLTLNKLK